jgi:uncharacterized protein
VTNLDILTNSHFYSLERFLDRIPESSLVLISNSRIAGLEDHGLFFEGTYAAFFEGDEITGVAALYWNGMAFLQAPKNGGSLVRAALNASGRRLTGLAGPWDQVQQAADDLGIDSDSCKKFEREVLFSVNLDFLKIPDMITMHRVTCRHPLDRELPTLFNWRMAYSRECLHMEEGDPPAGETWQLVRQLQKDDNHWVLDTGNGIVATSLFNAVLPGIVQVGGVYTLPEYRNKGYARSVVAGSLREAKHRGAGRAVLFTGREMVAVGKAYNALGFEPIGEYGLVIR